MERSFEPVRNGQIPQANPLRRIQGTNWQIGPDFGDHMPAGSAGPRAKPARQAKSRFSWHQAFDLIGSPCDCLQSRQKWLQTGRQRGRIGGPGNW